MTWKDGDGHGDGETPSMEALPSAITLTLTSLSNDRNDDNNRNNPIHHRHHRTITQGTEAKKNMPF